MWSRYAPYIFQYKMNEYHSIKEEKYEKEN